MIVIVTPSTMCHPEQRAVKDLGNNESLPKYTTVFKAYIFENT